MGNFPLVGINGQGTARKFQRTDLRADDPDSTIFP